MIDKGRKVSLGNYITMGSGCANQRDIFDACRGAKTARYVPRQSDTSETAASSVIEWSNALGACRAMPIRSVAFGELEDERRI